MNAPEPVTDTRCHYRSGDTPRSRCVSDVVLAGRIELPPLPARLQAGWAREIREEFDLHVGDVEPLPLARARTRWPDFRLCVAEAGHWLASQGLPAASIGPDNIALMACLGADRHHDGVRYGGAAFFNLFVSDDRGLDLHFPAIGLRLPLVRGTAVVFDTCQPHAVFPRGSAGFDERDFVADRDWAQYFLTWELPIEEPALAAALRIDFDVQA
ncbi:hypothetical protein [Xylophilus sp. GOD-11R]|uniref:hypothetical protein n=1 Tax=Xylophilus sp. GOD-11R TaxID=3089814 RepID=UPI00298BF680|nr:hypothetical protein [Xylophilus sp. GOD-11R]WPB57635.1 hypothetical protein R9X41_02990 [Xylophilus sp. GOD-11R]